MSKEKNHIAFQFLQAICPAQLYEEIEGDLIYKFNKDVKAVGEKSAKRRLLWNVIRFCRPGIVLRNKFSWNPKPFYMFSHYIKIFGRTLWRSKGYSFINISGLAIGLACSIFALLWITDELSYDSFHQEKEQIFALRVNSSNDEGIFTFTNTSGQLAGGLKELSEVEEAQGLLI